MEATFEQTNKRTGAKKTVTAAQKQAIEGSELANRFSFRSISPGKVPATVPPAEATKQVMKEKT